MWLLACIGCHDSRILAMSTPSRDLEPLRRYLVAVYRDDRLLSVPHYFIADLLGNLSFVFHEGRRALPGAAQPKCKASFHDWRPATCEGAGGCARVALLYTQPNLLNPLSYYGFWRASALPASLHAPTAVDGLAEPWWAQHGFVADDAWAEMLRLAPRWTVGEGGAYGCWFEVARGSGVAVNVGRSLRAINRAHLAARLRLNLTSIFARPVRGREHTWVAWRRGPREDRGTSHGTNHTRASPRAWREAWSPAAYRGVSLDDEAGLRRRYFDNFPWRLEAKVDLCAPATRRGYDSIQLYHEGCGMGNASTRELACGVEVVICHRSCLALRNRKHRAACVPGLPLRTGHDLSRPCACRKDLDLLNCAATAAAEPPPVTSVVGRDDADGSGMRLKRAFLRMMFQVRDCACSVASMRRCSTGIAG